MDTLKQSKVAKIINDHTLVITGGEDFSYKPGDRFEIIGKLGKEVKDPDDGSVIGQLDELKGTVFAKVVYPHMTIVESEKRAANPFSSGLAQGQALSNIIGTAYGKPTYKRLKIDFDQMSNDDSTDVSPIKIGDIIRKAD